MKHIATLIALLFFTSFSQAVFAQQQQNEVMQVVQNFFQALESQDTVAFRNIFMVDAYNYYVQEKQDMLRAGSQSPFGFKFKEDRIIKERFRDETVEAKIEGSIAMVWGTYDLWVNEEFSHCGIDAFTLLKTSEGWKISSLSFSMEEGKCE